MSTKDEQLMAMKAAEAQAGHYHQSGANLLLKILYEEVELIKKVKEYRKICRAENELLDKYNLKGHRLDQQPGDVFAQVILAAGRETVNRLRMVSVADKDAAIRALRQAFDDALE
jgi:hypothetical protein